MTRPSLTEIYDRMISDIESKLTDIGALLRRSALRIFIKVVAGAIHLLYGFVVYIADQAFVGTASSDYLDIIGNEYGINRNASTKAIGTCVATGTNGVTIPENTELQSSSNEVYVVDDDVTIASGTATLSITAKDAGEDGNDDGSIVLSFVSPISGVNSTVIVSSDGLAGGADEETDEAYRIRLLARKRYPPHGGSENDYITWAKEVSGVTRAWCFPSYNGLGTVAVAFVRDDDTTTIIPNSTQRDAMVTYLTEHTDPASGLTVGIPVTATNGLEIVTLTELEVDLTIGLYPNNTTVQSAVEDEIEALLLSDGGPGQTVKLSRINEAIGNAQGEQYHKIINPTIDIAAGYTQVHVIGTISFQDYS